MSAMRCTEFDAVIEEMLQPQQANIRLVGDPVAGVLHPDASQHMRQCERCNAYFRARTAVQTSLRALASAPVQGPSLATDRKVMAAYRQLQQGRGNPGTSPTGRVLAFPARLGSSQVARTRWGGLAVAAALLAMVGSGVHLYTGAGTVAAPSVASTPATAQSPAAVAEDASQTSESNVVAAESVAHQPSTRQLQARLNRPARSLRQASAGPVEPKTEAAASEADLATAPASPAANSIMHLASTGGAAPANGLAPSAGSTWPGYDNLMYCDPVVCSGPMQVVNIKVPASQLQAGKAKAAAPGTPAKPAAGKTDGKSYVNVEVVVGPDGVARAIRVAN